ncbi:hypothetical protein GCM10010231_30420 [Streptomyces sindenensis]|nr:hypothetical protein GCM10010231_30420 [Streptomyces sindenensis]
MPSMSAATTGRRPRGVVTAGSAPLSSLPLRAVPSESPLTGFLPYARISRGTVSSRGAEGEPLTFLRQRDEFP